MPPAVGAAGITAGSSLISGLTAPRNQTPQSGNPVGASQFIDQFQPFLNSLLEGKDSPDIASLMRAFDLQRNNLSGQEQRATRDAGLGAMGLASQQGFSNPTTLRTRWQNNTQNAFAPQFGNLAAAQAQAHTSFNRDFLNRLLQGDLSAIGMGGRLSPYARTVGGGFNEINNQYNSPWGQEYRRKEEENRPLFGG